MSVEFQQGRLLAGDAREYRLDNIIAEGGEGIVYRVSGRDDVVAKLYREWQAGRADKLERLIALKSPRLTKIAAWPLSRLQDESDDVVGFVMERLEHGWTPLHHIYQIRSRLEWAPNRSYQFLVRTARNLAACVHHVHEAGIVIGDLNESNVLVNREAMAKVIDVDSFQLIEDGVLYPCKVGKGELLAPELQGRSLEQLERTPEQDRFALAVLMFEVLVFGRHPYAGRPKVEEEVSLEQAITNGWYPYTKRREVPIAPPPFLTLDFLPERIQNLFEDAFEPGATTRPSANEWFEALKELEDGLDNCQVNGGHDYWKGCKECPWCELESRWNVPLFLPSLPALVTEDGRDAELIWERARKLPLPVELDLPQAVGREDLRPEKLPTWMNVLRVPFVREFPWFLMIPLAVGTNRIWSAYPWALVMVGLIVAVLAAAQTLLLSPGKRKVAHALRELNRLKSQWETKADPELFRVAKERMESVQKRLQNPQDLLQQARNRRIREANQAALNRYLRKYSILAADISPPIPTSKRDYLAQKGFRTAEDIVDSAIAVQADRSEPFWASLQEWRKRLEETFWTTSNFSLSPNDERAVMVQVQREARELREELANSEQNLLLLREQICQAQAKLHQDAERHIQVVQKHGPRLLATNDWPDIS